MIILVEIGFLIFVGELDACVRECVSVWRVEKVKLCSADDVVKRYDHCYLNRWWATNTTTQLKAKPKLSPPSDC